MGGGLWIGVMRYAEAGDVRSYIIQVYGLMSRQEMATWVGMVGDLVFRIDGCRGLARASPVDFDYGTERRMTGRCGRGRGYRCG